MTELKDRLCLSAALVKRMARGLDAADYRDTPFSPNRPTPLYDLANAVPWLERHCDEYAQCLAWKWNRGLTRGRSPETDKGMAFVAKVLGLPAGHGSPLPVRPAARRSKFRPLGVLPVAVAVAG